MKEKETYLTKIKPNKQTKKDKKEVGEKFNDIPESSQVYTD